jgi:hypothetical protein
MAVLRTRRDGGRLGRHLGVHNSRHPYVSWSRTVAHTLADMNAPRSPCEGCQVSDREFDGHRVHMLGLFVPRRIPVPDLRPSVSPSPRWPSRGDSSSRSRYRARARKLTLEQESAIPALAGTRSLRSLAADFEVSHETIRAVVRQNRLASG